MDKLKEVSFQSMLTVYANDDGSISMTKLKNKVETILEKPETKTDMNMMD